MQAFVPSASGGHPYSDHARLLTTRPAPAPSPRVRVDSRPGATALFLRGLTLGFALGMLVRLAFPAAWLRAHQEARTFVSVVVVPAEALVLEWWRTR